MKEENIQDDCWQDGTHKMTMSRRRTHKIDVSRQRTHKMTVSRRTHKMTVGRRRTQQDDCEHEGGENTGLL
jgi:hypothetical protein